MTCVFRDPIAREELHRRLVASSLWSGGCEWCGGLARKDTLFAYRTEHDTGRVREDHKRFCCLRCRNAYYGR